MEHKTIGTDYAPNIEARIIKDSYTQPVRGGATTRLTTFILRYPRFIHCELMTHRALSKNSASSRAIPLKKMVAAIEEDVPACPEFWGAEKPGMQSGEHLDAHDTLTAKTWWNHAAMSAVNNARHLWQAGVHKSIANRVLEPFSHMTVVCTGESRGLAQFFALRAHPMAQPEFQVLAYRMLDIYMRHEPTELFPGQWHTPFDNGEHFDSFEQKLQVCTARCARVSYLTHEGKRDVAKDLELHARLLEQELPHASPFEHCAQARPERLGDALTGNFGRYWMQYRKTLAGEFIETLNAARIMERKPAWISL